MAENGAAIARSPGLAGEVRPLEPTPDKIAAPCRCPGRPRMDPWRIVADEGLKRREIELFCPY